jgi:glycosyltransferase involved in cell wall biosynthesis
MDPPRPPRVAVIIPVYNRRKLVVEALSSVLAQTRSPQRLVVVDDGSTDETADVVRRWMSENAGGVPASLIRQKRAGASAARNRGAADAGDCDLLAFLDSDDLWPADYLQRMADALAAHPRAVAATTDRVNLDVASGRGTRRRCESIDRKTTLHLLVHGPPGTPNTAVRRSAFDQVGGYDDGQLCGEDYQLMLRLSLRGPWLYVPGEPVTARRGFDAASDDAPRLSKQYADRRLHLARMLERFIHEDGGVEALPERDWRRRLGRMWYAAARRLPPDRRDEAVACFGRALDNLPWHLRARWFALIHR